jgi:hypothetical protein
VGIKWPNCLTLLQGKRSNETWHYYEAADVQGIERIIIYIYIFFIYKFKNLRANQKVYTHI